MPDRTPFHLAFPVRDLVEAKHFYQEVLGLPEGRSDKSWIDFDLFGHQTVAHERPEMPPPEERNHLNSVDGHDVPVPHFGVILKMEEWKKLAAKLEETGVEFVIEPYIRFEGQVGEQATMFFLDPSGNALEFKAFKDHEQIFSK